MIHLPQLAASRAGRGADLEALGAELQGAIRGQVRFSRHDRMLYSTDASMYQVEPLGVVVPASTDDAVDAIRWCAARSIPMLPRGGGTSLAGQAVNRAVVLDLSPSCARVLEIDAPNRRCRVEPGITIDDLNASLAHTGLFFPPDPSTSRYCNIGGAIGNNAAGSRSVRYGRTSENLLGLDVCLASGETMRLDAQSSARDQRVRALTRRVSEVALRHEALIRERFPKTIRRNAGYALDLILSQIDAGIAPDRVNLAPMLCGSEGTLAITLGAELALAPIPVARGLAVIAFPAVEDAIDAVMAILDTRPSAVELLDDMVIGLARDNTEQRRNIDLLPGRGVGVNAALYVEYTADEDAGEIGEKFDNLRAIYPPDRINTSSTPDEMRRAWALRKAGEPLLHGIPGDRKPIGFVEDNAVPPERLGEFVRRFREIVTRHGTRAAYYAHASVGVLHVRPLIDLRDPPDRDRLIAIATEVADLARELGGVMSGEHGDGRVRGPLLERFFGPELMRAFGEIKTIFDPMHLLNPGMIVAPGPIGSITESLRTRPGADDIEITGVQTYFEYDDQHGFGGAVEMCSGAGVCRKKSGGTMCPSYMASLDERHATRGRANALRLAITGQLTGAPGDAPSWDDAGTIETLNLCLSCKACKTECPSNVDIARLKAEYAAQRFKVKGPTFQARLFGHVRTLNTLGSRTPRIASAVNASAPVKWLLEKLFRIDRRREVPGFCKPLHRDFAKSRRSPPEPGYGLRTVAIFADCFTTYNERWIGLAATRLLEAFGYEVRFVDAGCCGRAAISTGLLPDAIRMAERGSAKILEWLDAGVEAVLVLEPSCLSAITDDWPQLRSGVRREDRLRIAQSCRLVEQFLAENWDRHPRQPRFVGVPDRVLLHGHCHQKALWGADSSAALLRRAVGERLEVLDTGCCGMAGSFGYTTDRYDLSMKIGELALFPAAREAIERAEREGSSLAVAAPGTSCRHQLADGVAPIGRHPVELLAGWLEG